MSLWKVFFLAVICLGLMACLSLAPWILWPPPATFRGHTAPIVAVVASPDGMTLASMGRDETIKLWDVATHKERATLRGSDATFSADGKTFAWTEDRTIRLWDLVTGDERVVLQGHTDVVRSVAFSPDGKTLASGGHDKTVKLWEVATGKGRANLQGHTDWIDSVAFSPDGKTLASSSNDRTISLWDLITGKKRATLRRLEDSKMSCGCGFTGCVAFSPDGKTLASGHWETMKLWDVATGVSTATLDAQHDHNIESMAFSPDSKTLVSLDVYSAIKFWDVVSGRNTATFETDCRRPRPRLFRYIWDNFPGIFKESTDVPLSVLFTPKGKIVALGHDARDDTTVKMWQVAAIPSGKK